MDGLEQKIRAELAVPQLVSLATMAEPGIPWSRYVVMLGDDEMILRCATVVTARKVGQIRSNPNVHIHCGVASLSEMKPYLQIQGVARVSTSEEERHGFWNPMLGAYFSGPNDPLYAVVKVLAMRVEYWSPQSMEPEVWVVRSPSEVGADYADSV